MRPANTYTPNIRENVNKKLKFGTTMSVAKTCVQIAVAEGVTPKLTGLLTDFIMRYCRNTGLNIEEIHYVPQTNNEIQESSVITNDNVPKISNSKYHKPKEHPHKHYKSTTEENNIQHISLSFKTCNYCSEKEYNIREYKQLKANSVSKE